MGVSSANVARSFFMPNYGWEDLRWDTYHLQLETALWDAQTNRAVDPRAKESLRRIDYLFEKFMKNIPVDMNEKKDFDASILFERNNEFPSRSELHSKYFEFITDYCNARGVDKHDILNQYKTAANVTADCQRAIKRIINSEPLRLIPEQVKTFENFISRLRHPLEKGYDF